MSELRADTITASNGTGPVTLTKQQASKCWANWDMSGTPSIDESFAISTLTDGGTGEGKITFVAAFDSTTYGVCTSTGEKSGGGNRGIGVRGSSTGIATTHTTFHMFTFPGSGGTSGADVDYNCASWHGDLA